jgi:hypothetical protein
VGRITWIILAGLLGLAAVVGILASQGDVGEADSGKVTQVAARRLALVSELSADEQALVAANTQFTFDRGHALCEGSLSRSFLLCGMPLDGNRLRGGERRDESLDCGNVSHRGLSEDLSAMFWSLHAGFIVGKISTFWLRLAGAVKRQSRFQLREVPLKPFEQSPGLCLSPST